MGAERIVKAKSMATEETHLNTALQASGVDVVLCSYGSGEDAQAAQDLGLAAVGDATGAALARGARLLVVVDRRKADPTGRTIDAITAAFRK